MFFTPEDEQNSKKIYQPKIYKWHNSSLYDPKECTITGFPKWNIANIAEEIYKYWNHNDNMRPVTQYSHNHSKKEDNNMNKSEKANGSKNRMGVFSKGISFDTPSGTTQYIIPQIKEIKAINNMVVIIKFNDGTQEKAVLDSSDSFSIEQGVAICITKKILSKLTFGNGSSAYNKLIDYAMKIYKKQENTKKTAEEEKIKNEQKNKKYEDKKKKRAIKAQERERAEYIDILAEAISKALNTSNITLPTNIVESK